MANRGATSVPASITRESVRNWNVVSAPYRSNEHNLYMQFVGKDGFRIRAGGMMGG
jgi:hypothetical protein